MSWSDVRHRAPRSGAWSAATWRRLTIATGAAMLALTACVDARPFNGVELLPPEPAPAVRLETAAGEPFDLREQDGRVVLLFFGYTHCPDFCPMTLANWARTREALGDAADDVRWVFVSVDPARDTPAIADRYAKGFDPAFEGMTADSSTIGDIQRGFHITAYREPSEEDGAYTVAHNTQTFLVDRDGQLRILYPSGFTPTELAEDLRRLVR